MKIIFYASKWVGGRPIGELACGCKADEIYIHAKKKKKLGP